MGAAHPMIVINRDDDTEVAHIDLVPDSISYPLSWDSVMTLAGARLGQLRAPAGGYHVIILDTDGQPVVDQAMTWPGSP